MWCPYFFMPRGSCSETLLSLFVQDQRSVRQQEALTGCFGICWAHLLDHGEGERLRASSLTTFYITLSGRLAPGDFFPVCVVKTTESHKGENSNHQTGTLDWPIAWPPVKFLLLFHSDAPFLLHFDWLVLFCFAFPLLSQYWLSTTFSLPSSTDHVWKQYPKDFEHNPVTFQSQNSRSWRKTKCYPPTGSRVTNSPGQKLSFYL